MLCRVIMNDLFLNIKDHVFENLNFYLNDSDNDEPAYKAYKVSQRINALYTNIVSDYHKFENDY